MLDKARVRSSARVVLLPRCASCFLIDKIADRNHSSSHTSATVPATWVSPSSQGNRVRSLQAIRLSQWLEERTRKQEQDPQPHHHMRVDRSDRGNETTP